MFTWSKPLTKVLGARAVAERNAIRMVSSFSVEFSKDDVSLLCHSAKDSVHPTDRTTDNFVPTKIFGGRVSNSGGNVYRTILVPLGFSREMMNEWGWTSISADGILAYSSLSDAVHLIPEDSAWRKLFALYGIAFETKLVSADESPIAFWDLPSIREYEALNGTGSKLVVVVDGKLFYPLISFKNFDKAMNALKREIAKHGFTTAFAATRFIVGSLYSAIYGHKLTAAEFIASVPASVKPVTPKNEKKLYVFDWDERKEVDIREKWFLLKVMNPSLWDEDTTGMPLDYMKAMYAVS